MRFLRKMIPRAVLGGLFALLLTLSVLIPMNTVFAEGEGGVTNLSLYERASELTRVFATAIAPGSGVEDLWMIQATKSDNLVVAGNAGAFLGYADIRADDTGIVGWLMNSYTTASATISYDQLMNVIDAGSGSVYSAARSNPFFQYAGYGEVLTEMGLISTIRPGMGAIGRAVFTGAVMLVYLLANAAPFLFKGALALLTTLNPFKLFETAINGTASADLGVISGIAEYIGGIYEVIQNFSVMFLLPAFLIITVLSVLMFAKGQAMKKFSRYGLRVFMIFAGLPLIGATYTGVIEDLESQVAVGAEYADYLVLSTYVDFENWVTYSRLAPPDDANIQTPRYGPDITRSLANREMVLEINGTRASSERALALKKRYGTTSDISTIFNEGNEQNNVETDKMSSEEKSSFGTVFNLLSRHMGSARYTSSDYGGMVSGQIQEIMRKNEDDENEKMIVKMFTLSSTDSRTISQKYNPFDWSEEDWVEAIHWNGEDNKMDGGGGSNDGDESAKGLFTGGNAKYDLFQFGIYDYNIYNSGNLRYDANIGYNSPKMPPVVTEKTQPIGTDRKGTVGGLSPISMYNFLNTTFSNTGLTVFSPEKTSSDLSRDSYAAVTFAGTGVSSVTKWIENITVMLCLAVLAIAFGIMMISAAIKNIPRILSGVFGTALGSIQFITKLLISTAVLVIEVIGMIFMYTLSENIIMTLLLNFNDLMQVSGDYFGAGVLFQFLRSFMIIAVTLTVTIFMIKNMKVFKEMMEEVVTNAINRVMGALDTSTGGKGLDVAKTSGGRVGGDGKLTDDAKAPGGAAKMLGDAHDIESRREAAEDLKGHGEKKFGEKMKARGGAIADLADAKGRDGLKSLAGVKGKSYDREVGAKNNKIDAIPYKKDDEDEDKQGENKNSKKDSNATNMGQELDENGEVIKDEDGNAVDVDGNPISSSSPLAMVGGKPMVDDDGALLDEDGNTFTDEMGSAFYQDDDGRLVDEDGEFVALDSDGSLQPIADIPGHDGKPVSASEEAAKLDEMRYDADAYSDMQDAQDVSHYGLDNNGNAVGVTGAALQVKDADGNSENAQLDDEGFVTDSSGNRVAANAIAGDIDARGFEEVEDEDGNTHLQHKGDGAMKHVANSSDSTSSNQSGQNLTALAKRSNRENAVAKRANERVDEMKKNGATPFAVSQAERHASMANKKAQTTQNSFTSAMQSQASGAASKTANSQPVTGEHVASAKRHAQTQQSALQNDVGKLNQLKKEGAPQKDIARQQRKVEAGRSATQQATNAEQDLNVAKQSGRSYSDVHNARERVDRAEQVFGNAQNAHAQAVSSGQPKEVIAKHEQKMNQASKAVSDSHANMSRMSQKPQGSMQERDQAGAQYEQAQAGFKQASSKVEQLESGVTQQDMQKATRQQAKAQQKVERISKQKGQHNQKKQAYSQASREVKSATRDVNKLKQSGAPQQKIEAAENQQMQARKKASQAKQAVQKASSPEIQQYSQAKQEYKQASSKVSNLKQQQASQETVATPQEIKAAKKEKVQAGRKMAQARNTKQKLSRPTGGNTQRVPQVKKTPNVSPSKSYAELASSGVSNYADYSQQVNKHAGSLKHNQSKLQQAEQRLQTYKSSNRPPQIVKQAQEQVQSLKKDVQSSQANVSKLKGNAQGLLKNGSFQPTVASRPIRKNGTAIINQMVNMNHTQAMYDKLAYQEKSGVISGEGKKRMKMLDGRLNNMRGNLVQSGIKEDSIRDKASIMESTKHMQQSWDSFVSGKSVEHKD